MTHRLQGKTILVAGAGSIGAELVQRYAQEGANVVLGDIDADVASAVVREVVANGGTATATRLDGADEQSVAEAIALAVNSFGAIHGFHANFASFVDGVQNMDVLELPPAVFDESIRVNMRGYYLCTRAVLPVMLQNGGGAILYTSSMSASLGEPIRCAYAMAKAGVQALMRHVASRFGAHGVRSNCIAPGSIIEARDLGDHGPEIRRSCLEGALLKSRLGRAEDIAAMATLLLSDEGSYITGQTISIDGGTTMRP